jgi:asparagine synthase (glutamine-hydrolysing)
MEHAARPWFAHIPRWTTTGRIARFFSPALRAAVGDWDPYAAVAATLPPGIDDWIPLGRDQYVEAHTLMTGYLLSSQGDRMAMANSVEGRFPFLDHRVIEFANRLPPRLKLRGLTEKYLLKRAAAPWLPESVRARVKQPYRAPDAQSFFSDGRPAPYVAELFGAAKLEAAGYFDARAAAMLLEKCRAGRAIGFADNMAFVAILSTMLLHEQLVLGNAVDAGASSARIAA